MTQPAPAINVPAHMLFVGGMHRSGTTALAQLLGSSPEISGLESSGARMGEGQFLQSEYPTGAAYGGPSRWALDPRSHLTEADVAPDGTTTAALWSAWGRYWDPKSKFLLEKTPINLTKTRYLQAAFPGARFITITRHPLAHAFAVRKWSPTALERRGMLFHKAVLNWVLAHERFRSDEEYLERSLVIRYESLISEPEKELRRLSEFTGTSITDASMIKGGKSDRYAEEWRRATSKRIEWRRSLSLSEQTREFLDRSFLPREARRIRKLYTDRVEALGYDLDNFSSADDWSRIR